MGEELLIAISLGFSAALLGISGFESSANFIEEQKQGVFPKTLRNMWVVVLIFNPLVSLLSLGLLPLATIQEVPPDLLATMGTLSLGPLFGKLVSLDAVLVLSGAVLTSYVGVTGLVRRMSLDRCLPQVLLRENSWRRTNHWIIIGFFGICTSVLFVSRGNISTLAGVYSLSFLGVMALFAVGNMLLKRVRKGLLREVRASWLAVIVALLGAIVGLAGNVFMDSSNAMVFGAYFLAVWCVIALMFMRIQILKLVLLASREVVERVKLMNEWVRSRMLKKIDEINSSSVVYFTEGGKASNLNQAALYVLENEETNNLKIVHVYEDETIPMKNIPASHPVALFRLL